MILEYVKGFLTLFLLLKVLLYFVPKNTFSKYIAFFSGVILVIGMMYPVLQLFGREEAILEKLQYGELEEQMMELSINAAIFEEDTMELLMERYREILEENNQETEASIRIEAADDVQEEIIIEEVKIGRDAQEDENGDMSGAENE